MTNGSSMQGRQFPRKVEPGFFWLVGGALASLALIGAWYYISRSDFLDALVAVTLALSLVFILVIKRVVACWSVFVPILLLLYAGHIRVMETASLRPLALRAVQIMQASNTTGGNTNPSAKVLVWDVHGNCLSELHYDIPRELRAQANDPAITIFLVNGVSSRQVGWYRAVSGKADAPIGAFQDSAQVAVVQWPQQTLVGRQSITGAMPDRTITLRNGQLSNENHGNLNGALVRWIESFEYPPKRRSDVKWIMSSFIPPVLHVHQLTEADYRAEAIRRYPELGIANSPMNRAFLQRYNEIKDKNPAFFSNPNWPLQLAAEVASGRSAAK